MIVTGKPGVQICPLDTTNLEHHEPKKFFFLEILLKSVHMDIWLQ